MKFVTRAIAFLLIICGSHIPPAFSQSSEKIHVHFDKEIYLPGETVWFKAYILDAGKPSLSTNLYAGWYNKEGKLLKEKRYPIFNGTANGDFDIPDSLVNPVYQLRLFTKMMRQADSNNVFVRSVIVYQPKNAAAANMAATKTLMEAYPEGGYLVANINNHIGFKIVPGGNAALVTDAAVTDNTGKLVDSVYFDKTGVGKLQFIPKEGISYFLKWNEAGGGQGTMQLPAAQINGATLHTEMAGKDLYYIVQKNNSIPRFNKLRVNIHAGKDVLYNASINMEKVTQVISKLPADSLPPGLIDISLTDEDGNLLQKKSVFSKNKAAAPAVTVVEKSSLPKGKNVIDIAINDTAFTTLSISIVDEVFYPSNSATSSIADELLLNRQSSELYHSIGDEKKTDLLLMTSGMAYSSQNPGALPDNYLSVLGYYNSSKALPEKSILTLIANDKVSGKQIFTLVPEEGKNFTSTGLIVYDSAKLYYQLNNKDLSGNISLAEISHLRQPVYINPAQSSANNDVKNFTGLSSVSAVNYSVNANEKFNDVRTLSEVSVKGKKKNSLTARMQELDDRYASNMFKGLARGDVFNVLDDPMADGYFDVFSYLSGRVAGVTVIRNSVGGSIVSNRGGGAGGPLAVFIDEMTASFDMLAGLPVSQIAYIKVLNGIVITAGGSLTSGAIYVYTRKGNDIKNTTPPMPNIAIKGYDMPKEFSNPDYSDQSTTLKKDYRSTLYWNPFIETAKGNQKIRIEYYNNDVSKKPVLTLKGFNEEGELIEVRKVLE